jgi:F-type H+-transporting ATPase subunit b
MAVLIAEIVAFLVILFVLYRFVWPVVRTMARERQDAIQRQVDESEQAARRLEEAQRRLEAAEAEARKEVARIRDDARADAVRIAEELQEQANQEVERIRQRGQEQLAAQRDQMVRVLRAELGAQSLQLAERVVVDLLSDDTRRSATVDRFLDDLDDLAPRAGADRSAEPRVAAAGGGAS